LSAAGVNPPAVLGVSGRRYLECLGRELAELSTDELEHKRDRLNAQLDAGGRVYDTSGELSKRDAWTIRDRIAGELERRKPYRGLVSWTVPQLLEAYDADEAAREPVRRELVRRWNGRQELEELGRRDVLELEECAA
jgi:hypothetical protein